MKYRDAGVDQAAADSLAERFAAIGRSAARPEVLSGIGGFAGLCAVPAGYKEPVVVGCADGVGTKLLVAKAAGIFDTVGIDCVAMNSDDLVCCGAEPLFFLDYIGVGRLIPEREEALVRGVAEGCRLAGCALLGGETAQLPGIYAEDDFDLAGFCGGVVERSGIIDGTKVRPGDLIIGFASSGLHTNGYSLARRVLLERFPLEHVPEGWARSLGEEMLVPTRIYARSVLALARRVEVRAAAHITGGGIPGNLTRQFPQGLGARVRKGSWPVPEVFPLIAREGRVEEEEMYSVFNMGIGFAVVVAAEAVEEAVSCLEGCGERVYLIGEVVAGDGVRLEG